MRSTILSALVLVLSALAGNVRQAAAGHGVFCPRCHEMCTATVEQGTKTKHCWNVECKTICVPRVTFPWEAPCDLNCGECPQPSCGIVKHVRVLVKHEYECPTCKYTWTPCAAPCCDCAAQAQPPQPITTAPVAPSLPAPPPVRVQLNDATAAGVLLRLPTVGEPKPVKPAKHQSKGFLTSFFK